MRDLALDLLQFRIVLEAVRKRRQVIVADAFGPVLALRECADDTADWQVAFGPLFGGFHKPDQNADRRLCCGRLVLDDVANAVNHALERGMFDDIETFLNAGILALALRSP